MEDTSEIQGFFHYMRAGIGCQCGQDMSDVVVFRRKILYNACGGHGCLLRLKLCLRRREREPAAGMGSA